MSTNYFIAKFYYVYNMHTYNYIYIKAISILTIKIYFRVFLANQINKQSCFFTKSLRRPVEKDQIVMKLHKIYVYRTTHIC